MVSHRLQAQVVMGFAGKIPGEAVATLWQSRVTQAFSVILEKLESAAEGATAQATFPAAIRGF
jgi:hypothetical protein